MKKKATARKQENEQSTHGARLAIVKTISELLDKCKSDDAKGVAENLKAYASLPDHYSLPDSEILARRTWSPTFEHVRAGFLSDLNADFASLRYERDGNGADLYGEFFQAFSRSRRKIRQRTVEQGNHAGSDEDFAQILNRERDYFYSQLETRLNLALNILAWESILYAAGGLTVGAYKELHQAAGLFLASHNPDAIYDGRVKNAGKQKVDREGFILSVKEAIQAANKNGTPDNKITRELIAGTFSMDASAFGTRLRTYGITDKWRDFRAKVLAEKSCTI